MGPALARHWPGMVRRRPDIPRGMISCCTWDYPPALQSTHNIRKGLRPTVCVRNPERRVLIGMALVGTYPQRTATVETQQRWCRVSDHSRAVVPERTGSGVLRHIHRFAQRVRRAVSCVSITHTLTTIGPGGLRAARLPRTRVRAGLATPIRRLRSQRLLALS